MLAGAGCFIESQDGRLVAHHMLSPDVDPVSLAVLVRGTLAPLQAAVSSRRTIGLLPSGPVIEGVHGAQQVIYAALPGGSVWLLGSRDVPLSVLPEPLARVAALMACTTDGPAPTFLEGGPLPVSLQGCDRLWVTRLVAEADTETLLLAVPHVSTVPACAARVGDAVYLVAGAPQSVAAAKVLRALRGAHARTTKAVLAPVTAGISAAAEVAGLAVARTQADAVISVAPAGHCVTLDAVRSQLVIGHIADALAYAPNLGPDPLQRLLDYDSRRNAQLARCLLAWLDLGDIMSAAAKLGLHHNTMRYRLRRAVEILGIDFRIDAAAKAVIHLQLLAQSQRGRHDCAKANQCQP